MGHLKAYFDDAINFHQYNLKNIIKECLFNSINAKLSLFLCLKPFPIENSDFENFIWNENPKVHNNEQKLFLALFLVLNFEEFSEICTQ